MTNAQIILNESIKLMKDGVLAGSGIKATLTAADGTQEVIELPESIHTFAAWKAAGYSVKKGEQAIAKFAIWKYASDKQADDENADESGHCFLKVSFFFKRAQVEKIA